MEPVEVFPLAEYLVDEMRERGWRTSDVALRMPGEYGVNLLTVELMLAVHDDNLRIDDHTFSGLASAFSLSETLLRNLDASWRQSPRQRAAFEAPNDIFSGALPTSH